MQKMTHTLYTWMVLAMMLVVPTAASAVALMGTGTGSGSVSGTITNPTNVAGNIVVMLSDTPDGTPLYGAVAGTQGSFTVSNLPDGTYYLNAFVDVANAVNVNDLYGSFVTINQAGNGAPGPFVQGTQAIAIAGGNSVTGQNLTFDFQVVTGQVVNGTGTGVANVMVEAQSVSGFGWDGRPTDASGNFILYVNPGSYQFWFGTDYRDNGGNPIHVPGLGGGLLVDNQGKLGDWNQSQVFSFVSGQTTLPLATGVPVVLPAATELTGTIIDPNTNQGAAGVTVNVWPAWDQANNTQFPGIGADISTDAQGGYKLNVTDGVYNINVWTGIWDPITQQETVLAGVAGGVVTVSGSVTGDWALAQNFTFAAGQAASPTVPATVTLLQATQFSGNVVDANNKPIAGVDVQAQAIWNQQTGQQSGQWSSATTDASGNYSLTLVDGSYNVFVSTKTWNPTTQQMEPIPGVIGGYIDVNGLLNGDIANAATYGVTFGQPVAPVIPTTIQLLPARVFNGSVVDSAGNGVANINVNINPAWNTATNSLVGTGTGTQTDSSGAFSFSLADGQYNIQIDTHTWDPVTGQQKQIAGVVGGSVDQYGSIGTQATFGVGASFAALAAIPTTITLPAAAFITGQVVDATGAGVANVSVNASPQWDPVTFQQSGSWASATTDTQGNYTISLSDGKYQIQTDTGYWDQVTQQWVQQAGLIGGVIDAYGNTVDWNSAAVFDVVAGQTQTVPAVITLGQSTVISGQVLDANGAGVAKITVYAEPDLSGIWAQATTDALGNYKLSVSDGSYRLRFDTNYWDPIKATQTTINGLTGGYWDNSGTGSLTQDWNAAGLFTVSGSVITPTPPASVILPAAMTISGQVVDTTGASVANASINIHTSDWIDTHWGQADATGKFSVSVTPGVRYQIDVNQGWDPTTGSISGSFMGGTWVADPAQVAQFGTGYVATDPLSLPIINASAVTTGTTLNGAVLANTWDSHIITQITMDASITIAIQVDAGQTISVKVVDGAGNAKANAWVDAGLGGANTDAAGIATISVPTASNVSAAVPTFLVSVWPGWNPNTGVQDTSFIGGVVDASYSLITDWNSAANFATDLSDWPKNSALGNDANGNAVSGLLVTASAGATLTGVVSDGAGNPLPNIWVSANDNSFTTFFGTGGVTDSAGKYTMTLADGSYDVSVWDPVYINPPVQSVTVLNGTITDQYSTVVTAMNFTMGTGSTISGRVTDQSGAGLANMWVDLHTRDYTQFNGASTDANGNFSVSVTPATNYVAVVYGWGPNGDRLYQDNFYNGGSDEASATTIDGSANKSGVNFVMKSGAALSGTITGLAKGDTVWLDLSSESTGSWGNAQVTGGGTGSDTFTITGLPSATDYRLNWWSDKYISGSYGGTLGTTATAPVDWFAATMLDTTVGDVTGVDIAMSSGNTITLRVSGLQSGDSVDASAWSDSTANGGWGNATADNTGTAVVTVPSLALQADYRLWVNAYSPTQDYKSGYYATSGLVNYDQATLVDVTAASQSVTVTISQGGSVSGSVTGLAKGKSAWIDMWSDTTFSWGNTEVVGNGSGTDSFTIKGLDDAPDFKMSIYAEGLIGGYYDGSGTALASWQDAYSIAVVAGTPVTGVVMPLSAGKNISGSISGLKSGEYAWIDAWSDSTFAWGGTSIDGTGSAVNYTISGLSAASDYTVNFSSGNYVAQSLTGIDVSAADYTSANFTASTGGSIGGSITGLAANEWVWVDASGSSAWGGIGVTADANGSATYKIPALADASDYVVSVWSTTVGYYAKDSYGNAAATTLWDSASPVTVANSADTAGIDIDFAVVKANTVSISGTVNVPGATNVAAEIIAWSDTGGWGMATRTGTGTYTIDGLASGKYTISAWAFGCTELIVQIVNVDATGAVTSVKWGEGFASSGTLTVGTKNITGLDIQLSAGLKITGKITDQNGAAVPNVYVSAWNNSNMSGSGAMTDANGNYKIEDLSGNNSSYDLEVKTPSQGTVKATVTLATQDLVKDMQLFKANGIMSGVVTSGGQATRGAMVYVYDANGKIVDSTVTDASGKFSLDDLDSATSYRVDVDTNGDAIIDSTQTSTPKALTFAL